MFTFIKKDNSINLREHEFNRFPVIAYYNSEFVRICKSIVGHEWDAETKTWFLPKDCYHEFQGKISDKNFEIGRDLTEEDVKGRKYLFQNLKMVGLLKTSKQNRFFNQCAIFFLS